MKLEVVVSLVIATLAVTTANFLESIAINSLKAGEEFSGEIWAVLVAGSNTWDNYRHQADVCHAYQILHQHGVPDDHIIVIMYDDIAYNTYNRRPGTVINRPNGPDVYQGVPKDYTGENVTAENFLKVLRGDAEGLKGVGSGKVLNSGPNDRVFINLVDHGSPGIFYFPDTYLTATNLTDALFSMHWSHRYREMVLYVESCESGSLFQNLLPYDIQVYAVSASNPHQPSFACYWDNTLETYLGDVFSVKWMEDSDVENLQLETLKKQFIIVKKEVKTSNVRHWGDRRLGRNRVSEFLGSNRSHHAHPAAASNTLTLRSHTEDACLNSSVASPDVPFAILIHKKAEAETVDKRQHWQEQIDILWNKRTTLKLAMWRLAKAVTGKADTAHYMLNKHHQHDIVRWSCYLESVSIVHTKCINLTKNAYAQRLLHTLVNLCEHGYTSDHLLRASDSVCPIILSNVM